MTTYIEIELVKLKKKLLELGAKVEDSLRQSVLALAGRDRKLAETIIEQETTIDTLEVEFEEECLKVLALHQPVARDLRFIVSALKINNDLERIGDLAANIAERAVFLSKRDVIDSPYDVLGMADHARNMVRKSLDAFANLDEETAREVCTIDEKIDRLNREAYPKVTRAMQENPEHLEQLINYISISRYLERVADHSTNIAEDVLALLGGEIVRHRLEEMPEPDRDTSDSEGA